MRSTPFARANAMMTLIAAAMSLPVSMQQAKLAEIGPYVSRGKGRGGRQSSPHGAHMASVRAARKARNVKRHRAAAR